MPWRDLCGGDAGCGCGTQETAYARSGSPGVGHLVNLRCRMMGLWAVNRRPPLWRHVARSPANDERNAEKKGEACLHGAYSYQVCEPRADFRRRSMHLFGRTRRKPHDRRRERARTADVPDRPHADSRHASITAPPLRWPEHHTIIGGEMTQHTHTHTHTTHARTAGVPFSSPQLSSRAGRGCACAAPTARRADDHLGHCPGRSLGARARRARALPRAARLLPEGAWSATCGRPSAPPWGRGSGTSSRRRPT